MRPSSPSLAPGTRIADRYRVEAPLAQGGMGMLYRAFDERDRRTVALKVLLPELGEDIDAIKRFEREGKAFSRLGHPGIVALYDVGRSSSPSGAGMLSYIAMELVEGASLAEVLEGGPISVSRVVSIGISALSALAHAHAAGITHRDVKPANLMIVPGSPERVKLLDFGVAQLKTGTAYTRLTQTGVIVGTPLFMSPEQARSEPCDARTDIYALGLVLWSCLTGRAPYRGDSMASLIVSVIDEVPPRADTLVPGVPAALAVAIARAVEKRPEQRFASAAELASALRQAAPSTEASALSPSTARGGALVKEMLATRSPREDGAASGPGVLATRGSREGGGTPTREVSASALRAASPPGRARWPWVLALALTVALGSLFVLVALVGIPVLLAATAAPASTDPGTASQPVTAPTGVPSAVPAPAASEITADTLRVCEMMMTCCVAAHSLRGDCEAARRAYLDYPASAMASCTTMCRMHRGTIESLHLDPGGCVPP